MQIYNETYRLKNSEAVKRPRYTLRISFDNADTFVYYMASHADGVFPVGASGLLNCVKKISGQTQKINPSTATSTIGSIFVVAQNIGNALRDEINSHRVLGRGLKGKKCVVYAGFEGMPFSAYEKRHTFIIDDITYIDGSYDFKLIDIQRQQRKKIFKAKELTLRGNASKTATVIQISGSDLTTFQTVWHDSSYTVHPSRFIGYVDLDGEVIAHSGIINHATLGFSLQVVAGGRGQFGTRAVAHDVDAGKDSEKQPVIKEFIVLAGAAPKIIWQVMTGKILNTANVLPEHWHLGIDESFLRLSDYLDIGDDLFDGIDDGNIMRFWGMEETDGKAFIEKEVLRWINCFTPIYSDGAIGLKRLQRVLSDSATVEELNAGNITKYGGLRHAYRQILNNISIDWNYDFKSGEYLKTTGLIDAASILVHTESDSVTYKFLGVQTENSTEDNIRQAFDGIRDRYSGEPMLIDISVMPTMNVLEVGDVVQVVIDEVEDFNTGESLNRAFEVQQSTTDWVTGKTRLSLFGSSQVAGALAPLDAQFSLNDNFFSVGTSIEGFANVTNGVLTGDITLNGGASLMQTFRADDLTVPFGKKIIVNGNAELRIKGTLILNGKIDGKGRGGLGGAGQTVLNGNPAAGFKGFGNTRSGGMVISAFNIFPTAGGRFFVYKSVTSIRTINSSIAGTINSIGNYRLDNRNGSSVQGLPKKLHGTGGSGGGALIERIAAGNTLALTNPPYELIQDGGAGGNGGAGISIIARQFAFGGSAEINTSGNDGSVGTKDVGLLLNMASSAGAGGHAGGLVLFVDGNAAAPNIGSVHIGNNGACPANGTRKLNASYFSDANILKNNPDHWRCFYDGLYPAGAFDDSINSRHVQYIPRVQQLAVTSIPDIKLPTPDTLTVTSATEQALLGDGTVQPRFLVEWDYSGSHSYIGHAEVQAKRSIEGVGSWRIVAIVAEGFDGAGSVFFDAEGDVEYDIRVRYTASGSYIAASYVARGGEVIASEFITEIAALSIGDLTPPENVSNISFKRISSTASIIIWDAITSITLKEYQIREGADFATSIIIYNGLSNSLTLDNFIAGIDRRFWITAFSKSLIESDAPQSIDISTPLPTVVLGFGYTQTSSTTFDLSWDLNADSEFVDNYEIRNNGATWAAATHFAYVKADNLKVEDILLGTEKLFLIKANSGDAESLIAASVLTSLQKPAAPTNINIDASVGSYSARWSAALSGYAEGYELRQGGTSFDTAIVLARMSTLFYNSEALSSGLYTLRIKAFAIAKDGSIIYSATAVSIDILIRKTEINLRQTSRISSPHSADAGQFGNGLTVSFDAISPLFFISDTFDSFNGAGNGLGFVHIYEIEGDSLKIIQSIGVNPLSNSSFALHTHVTPDGRKLAIYRSFFNVDYIEIYTIDGGTGQYVKQSTTSTGGGNKKIDGIKFSNDGNRLLVSGRFASNSPLNTYARSYSVSGTTLTLIEEFSPADLLIGNGTLTNFYASDDLERVIFYVEKDWNTAGSEFFAEYWERTGAGDTYVKVSTFTKTDASLDAANTMRRFSGMSGDGLYISIMCKTISLVSYQEIYKLNTDTNVFDFVFDLQADSGVNVDGKVGFNYNGSEFYAGSTSNASIDSTVGVVGRWGLYKQNQADPKSWVLINNNIQHRVVNQGDASGTFILNLREIKGVLLSSQSARNIDNGEADGQAFLFLQRFIDGV